MTHWDSSSLFEKACVFFQRAYAGERHDDGFPLTVIMGFELLARAALAKVHPVLLADPQQGENLLYALGFPGKGQPRSLPIKSVLHRLTVVVDDFTDRDFKFATSILEMRNAELHSAELAFETYKVSAWLPDLLRLSRVLCAFLDRPLEELLGEEEADAANKMIEGLKESLKTEALEAVATAKKAFEELEVEDRLERIKVAKKNIPASLGWADRAVDCPACGAVAGLRGKVIRVVETRATDEGVEETSAIMPVALKCGSCGLELSKHGHLLHLGLAEQTTKTAVIDPVEYFGIEFDPEDYFEPDYGND